MKRGDVYQANLDPVIGSEQGGIRPVVIIQNDRGNRYSPTVIVVAVTTRRKKPQLPVHVLLTREESGLKEDSIVLTEQVRTLEKTRLTRYLGTVTAQAMKRIDRALGMSIGSICYEFSSKPCHSHSIFSAPALLRSARAYLQYALLHSALPERKICYARCHDLESN